jgi:hypothetical protein
MNCLHSSIFSEDAGSRFEIVMKDIRLFRELPALELVELNPCLVIESSTSKDTDGHRGITDSTTCSG